MRKISLCVTTYNRFETTINCFSNIINDDRVSEVVIVDDKSIDDSYERLLEYYAGNTKVKLFQNEQNLDCYFNKHRAIELATNDYVCILDSDNVFMTYYLNKIYDEFWHPDIILAPCFAKPTFNYRAYSGLVITKENVASYMDMPMFSTALNTFNFFINRKEYLNVWDGNVNPVTADSIYFNYCWLKAGKKIKIVNDLEYFHAINSDSHYINNVHRTPQGFYEQIESELKKM